MLDIRDLRKTYAGATAPALDGLDLTVRAGEFVSMIGPSGCGKTTALRIVAGLLEPSGGTVLVEGRPGLAPSRDKAIVFQLFNLFPWRTAADNVAYGLQIQGVSKRERRLTARKYLEMVGLEHRSDHYPAQLSGGECQRVGLARALAIKPKLLLMDEPFGSLDALTREHLQVMLQHICTEQELTVLFVTHSLDEAIFLSDRMIIMGGAGKVIAERPVALKRPRYDYDWRATDEYAALRSDAWQLLQQQFGRAIREEAPSADVHQ